MRHIVIAATAAVALAGASVAASAQQDKELPDPQAQSKQPKQPKQAPSATDKGKSDSARPQPGASAQESAPSIKRAEPRTPKSTDRPSDRAQSEKGQAPDSKRAEDRPPAAKPQDKSTAQDKSNAAQSKDTAQRKGEEADKKGTAQGQPDGAQKKGTAQRKDEDSQKSGPAAAGKESPAQDKQAQASKGERVELSQEQRTRVQTSIREQKAQRVTNVNFTINVGARIPRTVRLYALPRTVVEVVPRYRGYRYFVVEDRICIVDPATYEIVYVIEDSGPHVRTARLELSSSQRLFILSHLDLDRPSTDLRIRLALGAEIPNRVELLAFPDPVAATIPAIRDYRYVVVERRVVVVDPDDREVVLIIER